MSFLEGLSLSLSPLPLYFPAAFSTHINIRLTGKAMKELEAVRWPGLQFKDKLFYIHSSSLFNKAHNTLGGGGGTESNFIFISAVSFIPSPGRKSLNYIAGLVHSYCSTAALASGN
jgi:hypothetical protein